MKPLPLTFGQYGLLGLTILSFGFGAWKLGAITGGTLIFTLLVDFLFFNRFK